MIVREDVIKVKLDAVIRQWQAKHDRDLPLKDISQATGNLLSEPWLSRFKNGKMKRVDLEKLGILCAFLECTPNDLLWEPNGDDGSDMLPAKGAD